MKLTSWKHVILYLAILAVLYLAVNFITTGSLLPNYSQPVADIQQPGQTQSGGQSGMGTISVDELPPEGRATLNLIKSGGPFPYSKDGTVFSNYEGLLPEKPGGYYHEYTVKTPGASDRGARRIVAGSNGEYYYTSDHYRSFKLIRE